MNFNFFSAVQTDTIVHCDVISLVDVIG